MNKTELIAVVAESSDLSNVSAKKVVNALIDTVTQTLSQGNSVVLTGFGTFTTTERVARSGRNPQTGKPIAIPAATIPKFKAGKVLKDQLQQSND